LLHVRGSQICSATSVVGAPSLNPILFIDTEHEQIFPTVHIEPDHIQQLFIEAKIWDEMKCSEPVRLEFMLNKGAVNRVAIGAKSLGQVANAPTTQSGRRFSTYRSNHPFFCAGVMNAGPLEHS
jgi:hypothetical protein